MRTSLPPILVILICLLLHSCGDATTKKKDLVDLLPENASVVFKIRNLETLQSDLKNNSLLAYFKKTGPYDFFTENANLIQHLKPKGESLLSLHKINDSVTAYTFLTRQGPTLFNSDSISNKTIETLSYNNFDIQRVTVGKNVAFTALQDSIFIASSSQVIVQDILEGKNEKDPTFIKIYRLKNTEDLSVFVRSNHIQLNDSTSYNFASWISLETEILPDAITATGVALAKDSVPQLLSVFKGLIPQQNDLQKIIPVEAQNAFSFTYSDGQLLQKNLAVFRKDSLQSERFETFGSVNEIGTIELNSGKTLVLKSLDASITEESLLPFITAHSEFREVVIHTFDKPQQFWNAFTPLIDHRDMPFLSQMDQFFVFSENEETIQQIIGAYKNGATLSETHYYKESSAALSNASSLAFYILDEKVGTRIPLLLDSEITSGLQNLITTKYPVAILQFSHDRDFAHVTLVCKEASEEAQFAGTVSEEFSIKLDNQILGHPQLFTNHRSKGKDIVVQDVSNKLYFISSGGKSLWTKKLDGPILGAINEVDLLRNGKKQLAFVTENTFYVLDRNGKDVTPFPLKFKDRITQPLSVFDYDNNRKYRFVVTQGKEILMYDSQAKIVKGFTFKGAKSAIVQPPKHLRISNKDYIVIPEQNGTLNILSRVGKPRVSVSEKFDFTEIPIEKEGADFVVITKDHKKKTISQSGKISSQDLSVSESYWFVINGKHKVTLDDNLMRINGKLVELPFGIYTAPSIYNINRKTYITLTETQENKVYVYDTNGTILSGFPVYGTSAASMGSSSNRNEILLTVKGGENETLLYRFK
ncbi:hypothetical protein [Constantimarinum furrinae]|nr:hypothetical protein [Constantimarinum furrinae]